MLQTLKEVKNVQKLSINVSKNELGNLDDIYFLDQNPKIKLEQLTHLDFNLSWNNLKD